MAETTQPQPREITRAGEHDVKIIWQDGHESVYPARALRLACPCAGCVDEMTGVVRLIDTSISHDVHPVKIDLVGRYAISITWSDSHRTGIYSFDLLRKLCSCCQGQGARDVGRGQ
ncbi:MAG: hypothetical protein COV75_07480 [Candidatus Omnitrophica bacterium CG11_big_fil_rev_8_21_14_0_20_63_9]|nr:MAG: hypothetical protein COV75_07480 [Candidatus Omnitrophica bacterium CG11_big_fil_rev_8_21_14_0_20_63_9]